MLGAAPQWGLYEKELKSLANNQWEPVAHQKQSE